MRSSLPAARRRSRGCRLRRAGSARGRRGGVRPSGPGAAPPAPPPRTSPPRSGRPRAGGRRRRPRCQARRRSARGAAEARQRPARLSRARGRRCGCSGGGGAERGGGLGRGGQAAPVGPAGASPARPALPAAGSLREGPGWVTDLSSSAGRRAAALLAAGLRTGWGGHSRPGDRSPRRGGGSPAPGVPGTPMTARPAAGEIALPRDKATVACQQ